MKLVDKKDIEHGQKHAPVAADTKKQDPPPRRSSLHASLLQYPYIGTKKGVKQKQAQKGNNADKRASLKPASPKTAEKDYYANRARENVLKARPALVGKQTKPKRRKAQGIKTRQINGFIGMIIT